MTGDAEGVIRVLIVEDNPADVHLIREALIDRQMKFELEVLDDGESALEFFTKAHESDRPAHIVLLDLNLPKVGGEAILGRIRQNPALAQVPVVVLTSSDSPKDRSHAEKLGATAYVRKPSNLDEFFAIGGLVERLTSPAP